MVKGYSRRYTYFRFRPDMTLEVILPRGSRRDAGEAIRAKIGWISKEYERMAKTRNILERDRVMYAGSYLKLVFHRDEVEYLSPELSRGELGVHTTDARRAKELLRRWFLKETSSYVVRRVAELAPKLGVRPTRVDVREIGKWGYCTRGGRLSFSWQLIALPEPLREYVVLHELTHLAVFDHSREFRRKLALVCPDSRAREKELDRVVPYDRLSVG